MEFYDRKTVIKGDSVTLRPLRYDDTPAMYRNIFSDKRVLEHFIAPYCRSESQCNLKRLIDNAIKDKKYLFAIVVDGETVGMLLQTNEYDSYHNSVEMGYAIGFDHWGKGITSEAASAFIRFCFSKGVHRVTAECFKDNPGSRRVMEKCGMSLEGEKIEEIYYPDRYRDSYCYYILNK